MGRPTQEKKKIATGTGRAARKRPIPDETILLSICIATHNRAAFIGETLQSIVEQQPENVEIVVVDGASTDDTEQVVGKFVANNPRIAYVKLAVKGGVDQDYCRAVELARGKYCWLFTDDDILESGAIDTVLAKIETAEYSLVVVNAGLYSKDLSRCYLKRSVGMTDDKQYVGRAAQEAFFAECGGLLSFIGSVIIRRELWLHRDKESYFGSEFVHVGVIFQDFLPDTVAYIAKPWIHIRMNNSKWSSRATKIWLVKWPTLIWSFEKFTEESKRSVCPRYASQNLGKLLYYRGLASYSQKEYEELVVPNSEAGATLLVARLITFLPPSLTNTLCLLYARFRNRPWMVSELASSRASL